MNNTCSWTIHEHEEHLYTHNACTSTIPEPDQYLLIHNTCTSKLPAHAQNVHLHNTCASLIPAPAPHWIGYLSELANSECFTLSFAVLHYVLTNNMQVLLSSRGGLVTGGGIEEKNIFSSSIKAELWNIPVKKFQDLGINLKLCNSMQCSSM